MEFRAILRYAPFSSKKAKPVVDLVRGMNVNHALETLHYIPRRAAPALAKLIRSAVANAGQEGGVEAGELVLKKVFALNGPLKQGRTRWRPGPRGRACPIRKHTCHLEVVLEPMEQRAAPRRRAREAVAAAGAPATAAAPAPETKGSEG